MSKADMSALGGLADDKLEALVEIMVLAAHADGEFSDDERVHFEKSVESLTDGRLSGDALHSAVAKAEKALVEHGREERLKAVAERLPEPMARKVALTLAIQVTNADDFIRTSERELIMETAVALAIDVDEAANMVKQLTLK